MGRGHQTAWSHNLLRFQIFINYFTVQSLLEGRQDILKEIQQALLRVQMMGQQLFYAYQHTVE